MSFTTENEKQNRMSFPDVQVIHENEKFTTSVYPKPTFSEVHTQFGRFLPSIYKFGTVYTLAFICFQIYSSWTKLHTELLFLKQIFLKNGYPENFMDNIHVVKETMGFLLENNL